MFGFRRVDPELLRDAAYYLERTMHEAMVFARAAAERIGQREATGWAQWNERHFRMRTDEEVAKDWMDRQMMQQAATLRAQHPYAGGTSAPPQFVGSFGSLIGGYYR